MTNRNKLRQYLTFILLMVALFGCKDNQLSEKQINQNYSFRLTLYGDKTFIIMFHPAAQFLDTLFISKCRNHKYGDRFEKDSCESQEVNLSSTSIDSLYSLSNKIIQDFQLDKTIASAVNNENAVLFYLSSLTNTITIGYSSIKDASKTSPSLIELISFINGKIGKKMEIPVKI